MQKFLRRIYSQKERKYEVKSWQQSDPIVRHYQDSAARIFSSRISS